MIHSGLVKLLFIFAFRINNGTGNYNLTLDLIALCLAKANEAKQSKEEKDSVLESDLSCDGKNGQERSQFSEEDAEDLINFEDELHNFIYVR